MAVHLVDEYQPSLNLTTQRGHVNLYRARHQVGRIETDDMAMFLAAVDLLRNEGPSVYWNDVARVLSVGAEPIGEEES
jgi:hypothetical protein